MSRGLELLLILVSCALLGLAAGYRLGVNHVRGEWDAAQLANERGIRVLGAQERRRQANESDRYQAAAAVLRARAASLLLEPRDELQAPIPCVPGASAPLADLRIPAATFDRLRRAGADPDPD